MTLFAVHVDIIVWDDDNLDFFSRCEWHLAGDFIGLGYGHTNRSSSG